MLTFEQIAFEMLRIAVGYMRMELRELPAGDKNVGVPGI